MNHEQYTRVFVYGTLKPGEVNYDQYCASKIVEETRAVAFGGLFDLPIGYPAMTLGNSRVEGFVLTFPEDGILRQLDELEDYEPQRKPEENEYNRHQIETYSLEGKVLGLSWVYLMTIEQVRLQGGVLLRSGFWNSRC
ncbi:MAG: gamma-glutamylcyclotransferase [Symploca sp. SIO3C6]|uniref:Gamma-glutamylcyclotransferase n=1 Tax=Symploca sp. SIO1C4 TaxID=2607765 RepID=A0A6B3NB38_9CYAN|nr:gamma-glutamylcyclotransferase [Symploca sp. SIO3C6]NER30319.1 gamma-glutamylcyclotransferase [Symploca sp. SIO1C4]